MTKKLILFILIANTIFGLILLWRTTQSSEEEKFGEKMLLERYPHGYVTETVTIEGSFIAYSSANVARQRSGELTCDDPPIVYSLKNESNNHLFEVNLDAGCITNNRFEALDVDGDGIDEVISEWSGWSGGSGGPMGLVIWKLDKQEGMVPFAGYPKDISIENTGQTLTVKNLKTGQVSSFPVISFNDFVDYPYITPYSSDNFRLHFARFVWDFEAEECHFCPHLWELQVFKFENDKFVKDINWNHGERYLIKEKIPVSECGFEEIRKIFGSLE